MEVRGNETYIQTGAGVSSGGSILNLTNRLEAGNHEARLNAAAELGKLGEPAANNLVDKIESNNSSSEEINSYMLLALLETGDDRAENILSESFEKIEASNKAANESAAEERKQGISEDTLQAIEAKDKAIRKYIADSIAMDSARTGDRGETNAFERALKSEIQNSSIYVPFALSDFGPEEPGSETEKLLEALKSNKGSIRVAAMMALGEMREKAAVDPIIGILTRDYPSAKAGATIALGKIGDERAVEVLRKEMKDGDDEYVRGGSAIALGRIGDESSVPYLIDRLRDQRIKVRSSAALAIGEIGNEAAVKPLIEILETGKDSAGQKKNSMNANADVRKSAVLALGEIGSTNATETLIGIMTDKEEELDVRTAAASALGNIEDPKAIEALKKVLDDKNTEVNIRNAAFLALSKIKDQETARMLVGKLGDQEFGAIARKALIEMGELAVDPLIENLKTEDKKLKAETALILIEIGDKRVIQPLILAYQ
ncbi:HEAT repeat domain-containing protein [Methanosarcina sp. UBA5]|uniref:HEAT repeat domain-containing protein n=1 Tax=Methanosarcina sp. UBA5 TaxID=1915593 RepID=UPI0025F2DA30|nr:HEAT repeat domain-containing protein [Methanosarcina sp. UBA5]